MKMLYSYHKKINLRKVYSYGRIYWTKCFVSNKE